MKRSGAHPPKESAVRHGRQLAPGSGFSLFIDILARDALRTLTSRCANSKAADQKSPATEAPLIEDSPKAHPSKQRDLFE
jgi:hypothetical protein